MNTLEKLNRLQELIEGFDSEHDKLCSVFPGAYESKFIVSVEEIINDYIRILFGSNSILEDIIYDWRFVNKFGKLKPMIAYKDEEQLELNRNEDLAEFIDSLDLN